MIVCKQILSKGKKLIASVAVRSSTIKDHFYRVNLYADGYASCSCKGYKYRRRACRHIRDVRDRLSGVIPVICTWTDKEVLPQSSTNVCPVCGGPTKSVWAAPRCVLHPV